MRHALEGWPQSAQPPSTATRVQRLVKIFLKQLTEGCGDSNCPATTCYSHRKTHSDRPLRRYTDLSARAIAFWLADGENPLARLCPVFVLDINRTADPIQLREQGEEHRKKDAKSFTQQLFDTRAVKEFLSRNEQPPSTFVYDAWYEFDEAAEAIWLYLGSDEHLAPLAVAAFLTCIELTATCLPDAPFSTEPDIAFDERRLDCIQKVIHLWYLLQDQYEHHWHEQEKRHINRKTARVIRNTLYKHLSTMTAKEIKETSKDGAARCQLFGLVTGFYCVFLRSWNGESLIRYSSEAGKALVAIEELRSLVYDNPESFDLEIDFWTLPFARRRDPIEYATKWLEQKPGYVSLLSYPWLFNPSELVEFFRAICFRRMENAVEEAHLNLRLLVSGMAWHSIEAPQIRQLVTGNLRLATSRSFALQVRRHELLNDLFDQLWRRETRELLRPLRVEIVNEGEEGLDQGGVAQELFQSAVDEVLNPSYGMFKVDPKNRMTWFDPAAHSLIPLHKFELLGVLFALAVHNGFMLPVTFPLALYRALLDGESTALEDIEDGWPDLVQGLRQLRDWTEGDVSDVFARSYVFSFEAFDSVAHVNISDNGDDAFMLEDAVVHGNKAAEEAPYVTNHNRNQYIRDYIKWLTRSSVYDELSALKTGFHALLPLRMLRTLTPCALKILVEGHQLIDIDALQEETTYDGGYAATSETVVNFWAVVRDFDDEWKRRLLEFVTASDRLPVSGVRGLGLVIQRNGGDDDRLPTSMTCFSRLLLPEYRSRETLKERLLVALGESKGFGLR